MLSKYTVSICKTGSVNIQYVYGKQVYDISLVRNAFVLFRFRKRIYFFILRFVCRKSIFIK